MGTTTLRGSLFLNEANGRCLVKALNTLQHIHVTWRSSACGEWLKIKFFLVYLFHEGLITRYPWASPFESSSPGLAVSFGFLTGVLLVGRCT